MASSNSQAVLGAIVVKYYENAVIITYRGVLPVKKQTYIFSIHTSRVLLDATIDYII